jgi:hypothetical protein
MKLDRVTITGPDDSIDPGVLVGLSKQFPFVEWGILVSETRTGSPRFPSFQWIRELKLIALRNHVKLSMHLCGWWVRELLLGNVLVDPDLIQGPAFDRIQLNFHAENTPCNAERCFTALLGLGPRQYIFQIDGADGNKHLEAIYAENDGPPYVDAVPLFDVSGGAGILPAHWPKPQYMTSDVEHCYHGYAGGLGPENLEQQIPLIGEAAGDTDIWIDMETRVRSDNDRLFDLSKVARCLAIAERFVSLPDEAATKSST